MPSSSLLKLHEKIRATVAVVAALRKERERLEAEVALMQEENRRARKLARDHQLLLSERTKTVARLEKILKKLDVLQV